MPLRNPFLFFFTRSDKVIRIRAVTKLVSQSLRGEVIAIISKILSLQSLLSFERNLMLSPVKGSWLRGAFERSWATRARSSHADHINLRTSRDEESKGMLVNETLGELR